MVHYYGVLFFIGGMTKHPFHVFMIGPLALTLAASFRPRMSRCAAVNSALMLLIGYAPLLALYAHPTILTDLFYHNYGGQATSSWLSWDDLRLSTTGILTDQISTLLFVVGLPGIVNFLAQKNRHFRAELLSWAVVPWLIITTMPHSRAPYYFAPLLPAVALMISSGICLVRASAMRRLATAAAVIAGIAQYGYLSFAIPLISPRHSWKSPWESALRSDWSGLRNIDPDSEAMNALITFLKRVKDGKTDFNTLCLITQESNFYYRIPYALWMHSLSNLDLSLYHAMNGPGSHPSLEDIMKAPPATALLYMGREDLRSRDAQRRFAAVRVRNERDFLENHPPQAREKPVTALVGWEPILSAGLERLMRIYPRATALYRGRDYDITVYTR